MRSKDNLALDRGLLSGLLATVLDGLQGLGSQVQLCPGKLGPEEAGSLSDFSPLSELLVRQSYLQSL